MRQRRRPRRRPSRWPRSPWPRMDATRRRYGRGSSRRLTIRWAWVINWGWRWRCTLSVRIRRMRPSSCEPPGSTSGLTRRAFLGAAALPLAAAACRRVPYDARAFHTPARSAVTLLPADSYDVDFASLIGRGLTDLGLDVRGRRVFLKPN